MNQSKAEELFEKHLKGTLSQEERLTLEAWYLHYADSAKPLQDNDMLSRSLENMDKAFPFQDPIPVKKVNWGRFAIAATIFITMGTAFIFHHVIKHPQKIVYDVAAGKNTATLTLANGQKIKLAESNQGTIAQQMGVSIVKAADGKLIYTVQGSSGPQSVATDYNTIATANGEQYQVNLPDGTKVWLNAASSIRFPTTFNDMKERKVELTGEAYFEVAKDKAHPFTVQSNMQKVRVVGTHFDINAYADEPFAKTTLLEGSVILTSDSSLNNQNESITLSPGQQASVSKGKSIKLNNVDVESVVDWKNGDFVFKGDDFRTSMRKIARWYNVEIAYEADAPVNVVLGGWLSRKNNLSVVLDRIESTGNVHFKVEERRITVIK